MKIGFIGQGFIGKSYADDYEARGFSVVRYALDPLFEKNKNEIQHCDIVFIAVPTPSTPSGFDDSIVRAVLPLVGVGKMAVIKSTLVPGTTRALQRVFSDRVVMHSPEFLSSSTAAYDAQHPQRNIIGITDPAHRPHAERVLETFSTAPYSLVCTAEEAELIKYARNMVGVLRTVFYNLLYDVSLKHGAQWGAIADAISHDPDNGPTYTQPIHKSGRGAGGFCFIKDLEAFRRVYREMGDPEGSALLDALVAKNNALLRASGKDLDLLRGVYGE